ncbi:MAG: hypothetical protein K8U57_24030 [Planctomycetes bacterium]|nr:hypothetical protein [Planctomycetota bacterium]
MVLLRAPRCCTALVEKFDAGDPKASCKPNALVLFNPFLNGKGRTMAGSDGSNIAKAMSPTLFLKKDAPPCVIFFGTSEAMLDMRKEDTANCKELGVKDELPTAAEQPHGFFNREPWLGVTTRKADDFLTRLSYQHHARFGRVSCVQSVRLVQRDWAFRTERSDQEVRSPTQLQGKSGITCVLHASFAAVFPGSDAISDVADAPDARFHTDFADSIARSTTP